jgi:cysteine desulfurase/selenocysteine lyase
MNISMDEETRHREFPVTANRIFMDHARVAPLPAQVRDAMVNFVQEASEHGNAYYAKWMQEVERTRKNFARMINADEGEVAFVKNTSEGISIVASGLDWKAGDNVVVPDIEFPANVYPWMNLKQRGVETRFVKAVEGRILFEDIVKQVDAKTRLISISSVEFNSGFRNDLNRIGTFCKEKEILFFVDAIQSLGVLPMDVKRDHIDFLAADGHKWMLSVEGLGGFYIAKDVLEKVRPVMIGWDSVANAGDFLNYDFTLRADAKRFEEGSFNVMSIHGWGAALDLFHEVGIREIEKRVLLLGDKIIEELRRRNFKILNSTKDGERSGIVLFTGDMDFDNLEEKMCEQGVSLTVRGGRVRLSPHFYNTEKEIEKVFEIFDSIKA